MIFCFPFDGKLVEGDTPILANRKRGELSCDHS